ncbi:hypothetical protein niasHT_036214 [Heterodera trifolii]|uniref:Uncharacterized protein n=1 Tax=Heterodera trifolii TaxID=157864 RepID=A0ABD2IIS1_9BILA
MPILNFVFLFFSFISGDCWLSVFDLLSPRQLGLGIAMISHRFDYYVDEHLKTRKWTLAYIEIRSNIGENGTKEMAIVKHSNWKPSPIPQILVTWTTMPSLFSTVFADFSPPVQLICSFAQTVIAFWS